MIVPEKFFFQNDVINHSLSSWNINAQVYFFLKTKGVGGNKKISAILCNRQSFPCLDKLRPCLLPICLIALRLALCFPT